MDANTESVEKLLRGFPECILGFTTFGCSFVTAFFFGVLLADTRFGFMEPVSYKAD
jgi:hypothetical protein